ncbi:L-threonylcarbamoyladenylate synthase [Isoptericola cucumis]
MSSAHDVTDPNSWGPAIDEAVNTISRGGLVVLPTDTVYGIGADAFDADAVAALLAAKGRGRQMPPPVLVPDVRTLDGLATDVPDDARRLVEAFWPGGFTIILRAQPSLHWDLGETHGTVALRMPDHPAALALLRRTGPMAVSSANRTGSPAALDAADAREQLGDAVGTYLDGGTAPGGVASTIVDATGERLRVVRAGAITLEALRGVAPVLATDGTDGTEDTATAETAETAADGAAADAADADETAPATDTQQDGAVG